ncbi:hypothetical protein GCM10027299_16680 [Larkinella ripae]
MGSTALCGNCLLNGKLIFCISVNSVYIYLHNLYTSMGSNYRSLFGQYEVYSGKWVDFRSKQV